MAFSAGWPAGCVLDPFYTDRSEGILSCPAVLVQFSEWETVPSVRPQRSKPRCLRGTLHDALENHQSFHLGLCESLSQPTTGLGSGWTGWFVQFHGRTEIIKQQGKSKQHHSETGYAATVSWLASGQRKTSCFAQLWLVALAAEQEKYCFCRDFIK